MNRGFRERSLEIAKPNRKEKLFLRGDNNLNSCVLTHVVLDAQAAKTRAYAAQQSSSGEEIRGDQRGENS